MNEPTNQPDPAASSPDAAPADLPPEDRPPTADAARETQPSPLWVERERTRVYRARNGRGGEVLVGPADLPDAFTPGELLKLALAACTGMSADHRIAHHLGEDYRATVGVSGANEPGENRYASLQLEMVLPLAGLDEEERQRLEERSEAAVHKSCTVGRTLRAGAEYTLRFSDDRIEA